MSASMSAAIAATLLAVSLAAADAPRGDPEPPGPEVRRGEPASPRYVWPVVGSLLRRFEPPASAYGPGHRGIDIGAPPGTPVRAAAGGQVAFAGTVAGRLYASIDHPDGIRTTYSWLSRVETRRGDEVAQGQVIARTGPGHPGAGAPHLHFGARIGETYIDPLLLLGTGVRLAPLPDRNPEPPAP